MLINLQPKIKIASKSITVNGKRAGVRYDCGPWIDGVDPTTIKIRPRGNSLFPAEFRSAFAIENKSDGCEDYFEADSIRLTSAHPLYKHIKAVC